jgi:hypothetical protein
VCRELSPFQIRPKPGEGSLADIVHRLPPLESLLLFNLGHGMVVLGAFGPVIELRIAQRHLERAMPHQLFHDLQRGARIQELGGKRMPEGISTLLIIRRWCVFATTTIPSLVRLSKSSGGYGGGPRRV